MTRATALHPTTNPDVIDASEKRGTVAQRLVVGVVTALLAGAICGLVARLMMRLATLAADAESGFSLSGTASILIVFAVVILPGAVLASLVRRRGRSALLIAGAVFLCVPAIGVASADLAALGELSGAEMVGVVSATVGVFAAILALPFVALRLIAIGTRQGR